VPLFRHCVRLTTLQKPLFLVLQILVGVYIILDTGDFEKVERNGARKSRLADKVVTTETDLATFLVLVIPALLWSSPFLGKSAFQISRSIKAGLLKQT
jgi:hypothetical protein